ncbi:VQ motif-containing protein 25-like [Magnolia sinica]|uniref:VQ motif-containing protein 25-like n=1 Tax=Magnolia sinica TaxID=86752 RepID=UPI002657F489|nr:VQ motif-containing protein 25-like [Magnolia sinica]
MKEVMKVRTCEPDSPSPGLAKHKESQMISNFKPKIRIIHIFAPEIIKTDVSNFRELVQKLTGKPTGRKEGKKKVKKATSVSSDDALENACCRAAEAAEFRNGFLNSRLDERVKEEEEDIWGEANSSFLGGLGDFDGFIQGLTDFPLLPINSSRLGVFGETHVS